MITSFTFGLKTYRGFFQQNTSTLEINFNGTTALVGPNNSGKSSVLRAIYELRHYFANVVGREDWREIDGHLKFRTLANQSGPLFIGLSDPLDLVPSQLFTGEKKIEIEIQTSKWRYALVLSGATLASYQQYIELFTDVDIEIARSEVIEISTILANATYIGPYRNLANQGGGSYYDLPIGASFISQWRSLKTGANRASKLAVIQTQRDIAQLLGYDSLEINASEDGQTLSVVFDGSLIHSLSDVGSGLAQMIFSIVTVANRKPSLVLIDEPESHLHPMMQAKFVEALNRHAQFGTVFTTHSIGLARQVANPILVVTRDKVSGKSSIRPLEDARNGAQLLGEMSYSQFSSLGGKYLLLVEGTTEIKTVRVLLRKLEIDGDVFLIPLGGSALIGANRSDELSEFTRIGAEVFVLVDSERVTEDASLEKERAGFLDTCVKLFGVKNVHITTRRATENYFSDAAVKRIKGEKYRALTAYEKLEKVEPAWGKNENWRIAEVMEFDEIADTDIGKFLTALKDKIKGNRN